VRAILLPNGNLLIPVAAEQADDTDAGEGLREIGPDHPDYGHWLALAQPGEDPRKFKDRRTWIPREEDLSPEGWRN
jgi:hypothetical protein